MLCVLRTKKQQLDNSTLQYVSLPFNPEMMRMCVTPKNINEIYFQSSNILDVDIDGIHVRFSYFKIKLT